MAFSVAGSVCTLLSHDMFAGFEDLLSILMHLAVPVATTLQRELEQLKLLLMEMLSE